MNYLNRVLTIVLVITSLLWLNSAVAKTYPLANCSQLQAPNAVLLVHASWCPHCQTYLPIYKAVSNRPDMKGYKFYVKRNDGTAPVCGVAVRTVPMTFTHNMRKSVVGQMPKGRLASFVKS